MCLLVSPDSGEKPIPFKMYIKRNKRSNYTKLCAKVCFKLPQYQIEVLNFTGDGLQRQTDASTPVFFHDYCKYLKILIERDKRNNESPLPPSWESNKKHTGNNWLTGLVAFCIKVSFMF
jgi:hypothetical protein